MFECFSQGTGTFLIMGNICTRSCRFCNIGHGSPSLLDANEPRNISEAVSVMGLSHVVITSVTRDDLQDGGASHFRAVIEQLKREHKKVTVEVLIPDFQGSLKALTQVMHAGPDVLNHNVETVSRLYQVVRPEASYERSLLLLQRAKEINKEVTVKSGLMVGLGEQDREVFTALDHLKSYDCDMVTVGQYMQPSRDHLPVQRYVHPDTFDAYRAYGEERGMTMFCGPLVRSSYHAGEFVG